MLKLGKLGAALAAGALLLSACSTSGGSSSSSSSSSGTTPVKGGTAVFADPPGAAANYIFPFMSLAHFSVDNTEQFQYLMYRPLYWFGNGTQPTLNTSLSIANPPVYSNGNRTVTITLKHYMWSNGEQVTARDVQFWMNLLAAEKANWAAYVPSDFPDNVTSVKVNSPTSITFNLNAAYNSKWFTYNELSQITPLPMAWDKTSATGPTGTADLTPAGAAAVYTYLKGQAHTLASYATNPLWQVVDGPWKLQSFQTDGYSVMVPNPSYSGPVKPHLAKFIEQPFTSVASEFGVLESATGTTNQKVNVGYVPLADTPQLGVVQSKGYTSNPWILWGINFFPLNFNNPTMGPVFKQLYFRQALQHTVDQPTDMRVALKGYGYPTYGPIPTKPSSSYLTSVESHNPYPFSVSAAVSLLKSHGWAIHPGGTDTCAVASKCGPGIAAGTPLAFNLVYASGTAHEQLIMEGLKTDASKAGIQINLSSAPFNQVIGAATPCTPSQASCSWQAQNWGGGWSFEPDYYPTGGEIFAAGAGSNSGSYNNATNNANIIATHKPGVSLSTYENFLALHLPVVWQPNLAYQVTAISSNLHGVTPQESTSAITPENWYFVK